MILSAAGVACFTVVDNLYFVGQGYSLTFIGALLATFNLAVAVAELPFAMLFDRWSNKAALQIGNLIRTAAFILFFLNFGPGWILTAEALAGVGAAALSGTANALIINHSEGTTADGRARSFGKITYLSSAAAVVGGLIGVGVYLIDPRLIWLTAAGFYVLAGAAMLQYKEHREPHARTSWKQYRVDVFGVLRRRGTWLLVLTNAGSVAPFLLWQIKFDTFSIVFVVVGFLLMKFAGLIGPLILKRFKVPVRLVFAVAIANLAVVGAFGAATAPALIAVTFFFHVLLHIAQTVLISGYFHASVDNTYRATAGSIVSMADSAVIVVLAPLAGAVSQAFGLGWGVSISCILYALVAIISTRPGFRRSTDEPNQEKELQRTV
ncbi:MFS transporter [Arthrobacter methylotrophus]|uniref:MFS transporter n=1 Tax=Arthrobacter methylotrophus TaxID=121291 RepID=UPI0031E73DA9